MMGVDCSKELQHITAVNLQENLPTSKGGEFSDICIGQGENYYNFNLMI